MQYLQMAQALRTHFSALTTRAPKYLQWLHAWHFETVIIHVTYLFDSFQNNIKINKQS